MWCAKTWIWHDPSGQVPAAGQAGGHRHSRLVRTEAPWFTVEADDKRQARLNCIRHILSNAPCEDMTPEPVELPPRKAVGDYHRPPLNEQFIAPNAYG